MKKALLFFILSAISTRSFSQCMIIPIALDKRINTSTFIFEGNIISSVSFWDNDHHLIYTSYRIGLFKDFKGNLADTLVDLIVVGGTAGNLSLDVHPSPDINIGCKGIFLANQTQVNLPDSIASIKSLKLSLHEYVQGFIRYDSEGQIFDISGKLSNNTDLYSKINSLTGKVYKEIRPFPAGPVVPKFVPLSSAVIDTFYPKTISAGTDSLLTIKGSGFGRARGINGAVQFRHSTTPATSWYTNPDFHYKSWSDTEIVVSLFHKACSGTIRVIDSLNNYIETSDNLKVQYAWINTQNGSAYYRSSLRNRGYGGYIINPESHFLSDPDRMKSFLTAVEKWRCATGINLIVGSTIPIGSGSQDGYNSIRIASLSGNLLGLCYSWRQNCVVNGSLKYYLIEFDIEMADINWYYGSGYYLTRQDFETAFLHEMGHAHQFDHVADQFDFMYPSRSAGSSIQSFSQGQYLGGSNIVKDAQLPKFCNQEPMQLLNASNCGLMTPKARFFASKVLACPGVNIQITDSSYGYVSDYIWNFGSSAAPVIAYGKGPHLVNWADTGKKTIQLIVKGYLANDTITKTNYVLVQGPVEKPSAIIGDISPCNRESIYSVNRQKWASFFLWSVTNASDSIMNDTSILVKWDTSGLGSISVIALNSCGASGEQTLNIVVRSNKEEIPVKNGLSQVPNATCIGRAVTLQSQIKEFPQRWYVPGASIIAGNDTSNELIVKWDQSNVYTVKHVTYTDCDSLVQTKNFYVGHNIKFSFDADRINDSVHFTITGNGDTYFWNFGDGDTSSQKNPVHYYPKGNYAVRVIISSKCGQDTLIKNFDFLSAKEINSQSLVHHYPNPFDSYTSIELKDPSLQAEKIEIIDLLGNRISIIPWQKNSLQMSFQRDKLPAGIYLCKLVMLDGAVISLRFVIY